MVIESLRSPFSPGVASPRQQHQQSLASPSQIQANSSVLSPSIHQTTRAANVGSEQLENAARLLDLCLHNDTQANDLRYKLKLDRLDIPTSSGLADSDYPNLEGFGLRDLNEFSLVRRLPMPQELLDQFAHMQCNCAMGLFPSISRAWVTIDSDLFAWNYETGADLAYFDGLQTTIVCVGLAKPKPGVFQSSVHSLLCVATAVDVVLLAVNFSDHTGQPITSNSEIGSSEMHLLPSPLFRLPLDGAVISHISSTRDGRIFLAARDGCLYEVDYHERGWFGRQCKKLNHSKGIMSYLVPSFVSVAIGEEEPLSQLSIDHTRHILYTRSEKGSVQVFDLGARGGHCSRVFSLSSSAIEYYASSICQTIEPSNFRPVVHISAIESTESAFLNLMAVTQTGVRLYFTCYHNNSMQDGMNLTLNQGNQRPVTLHLVHVRLPPGFTTGAMVARPNKVHLAFDNRDMCVFLSATDDENDVLWTFSSANFPFQQELMESYGQFGIRGRTWAVEEAPGCDAVNFYENACARSLPDSVLGVRPALTVMQHMYTPRKVLILNAQGIQMVERPRPVDLLQRILLDYGPESVQARGFFSLHQPDQACVMCLVLVCSLSLANQHVVAERAIRAFFLYGGDATIQTALENSQLSAINSPLQASTPAQPVRLFSPPEMAPSAQQIPQVKYSSRHNGLYLYFGRLLGPLWNMHMTRQKEGTRDATVVMLESAFTSEELSWFVDQIVSLHRFLDTQAVIPAPVLGTQNRQRQMADAVNAERQSLLRLCELVERSAEILSLWKLLCDHQFHVVVAELPNDIRQILATRTFRNLVVDGKELCCDLITCLIRQYLGDQATTDALSERLRRICPGLFTTDDATIAKASELVQRARTIEQGEQKQSILNEALNMYKKVANQIQLHTVCHQLQEVHCFEGIVELVLCAVERLDPQQLGLIYYKENGWLQETDTQLRHTFIMRMNAYKCITEALDKLLAAGTPAGPVALTTQMAQIILEQVQRLCFSSSDELCHVSIFDWFLERNQPEKLLNTQSNYLENYLHKRIGDGGSHALKHLDLLWKYYEKQGKYMQAAQLLSKLAETHNVQLDLRHRLSYLSQSVMCAKSAPEAQNVQAEFVQELEDKLEVARLQSQVLDSLCQIRQSDRPYISDAISRLNAELLDVTQLYGDFAEEFGLPECKLAIVHCAGHYDTGLIETLWKEIVEKELALSQRESIDTRQKRLATKLSSLAKLYSSAPRYLPSVFLVRLLQTKAFEHSLSPTWVAKCGRTLRLSQEQFLETLDTLYKSREPLWRNNRKAQIHLLNSVSAIVRNFADTTHNMTPTERRNMITRCLDVISFYLIELQSLPSASPEFNSLKLDLQSSQMKLERI